MGRHFFVWWSGAPLGDPNEGGASPENILGTANARTPRKGELSI